MVSRKDVAERAGVSVAVVSYVLNNKQKVKESTKQKVLHAVEELGYKPNLIARSLKTKKTNQLAVMVNFLGNPFESGLLLRLELRAREKGYFIFFQQYQKDEEEELKTLFMGRVDGIILLGQSFASTTLEHFSQMNIPLVSIMKPVEIESDLPFIDIDWLIGMRTLLNHLQKAGHKRIGFMTTEDQVSPLHGRFLAFLQAIALQDMEFKPEWLLLGNGRLEWAEVAMEKFLSSNKTLPFTAMICANDLMATGVLTACKKNGLSIPTDLAVAGCENILMTSQLTPAITCLHYPRVEAANMAIDFLLLHLEGPKRHIHSNFLHLESNHILERGSTSAWI